MTKAEVIATVLLMRAAQRRYFRERTTETLDEAKTLERRVDRELAQLRKDELEASQPSLFQTWGDPDE